MTSQLRIYRTIDRTEAEGPGVRAAVWVQGCTIRCPGCFNPHTWTTRGGRLVNPDELGSYLIAVPDIEGVTFLGGEPFEQAGALAIVAEIVRASGRSTMTFSGLTYDELREREDAGAHALLAATDLLADGPYLHDQQDFSRPWIGSRNQGLRALTPRYRALVDAIDAGRGAEYGARNRLEVRLGPNGNAWVNGMADKDTLEAVRRAIRRH